MRAETGASATPLEKRRKQDIYVARSMRAETGASATHPPETIPYTAAKSAQ